jgi:predicted small lipoprotein YifL
MNRFFRTGRPSLELSDRKAFSRRLSFSAVTTGLVLASLFLLAGCGKKGPPVAPTVIQPIAVETLEGEREGDRVFLSWTMQEASPEQLRNTRGFAVYRSKTSLGDESCMVCPLVFERVGDVPLAFDNRAGLGKERFLYNERVQMGYRYIYKVAAVSGDVGPYSPVVEFIYTEE